MSKEEKELEERKVEALERIANTLDYLAYQVLKEGGVELSEQKASERH